MTAGVYFVGSDATITAGSVPVGAIHGWTFAPTWEVNDLYGSGSIFKIASAKYDQKIEVKIESAIFDPASSFIANSIMGDATAGTPFKGSIYDTTNVFKFTVIGTVDAFDEDDGSIGSDLSATTSNVYFEEIPFEFKEMEWVAFNFSGIGQTFALAEAT